MKNKCDNVITLKQYGPTCWFNSILMAVLYSEESRKLLLKKSKTWNNKILIFKTLKHILEKKFLRSNNIYNDYEYFDKIRPEYILEKLYKYNKKKFTFNPKINKGYASALYIRKIYKLLGVKVLYLDLKGDLLYYSKYNNFKINNINKIKKK
jgi:ribosomal protein S24E